MPRKVSVLTGPQPPMTLAQAGLELWQKIHAAYRVTTPAEVELLAQACAAADRVAELAERIRIEGVTVVTKSGAPKPNPLLGYELAGRQFISKTLRQLGLIDVAKRPVGRPPAAIGWRGAS